MERLRQKRDAKWSLIRRTLDGGAVPPEEFEASGTSPDGLLEGYETSVKAADEAADKRVEMAEATAKLAELERSIDEGESEVAMRRDRLQGVRDEAADHERRWRHIWSGAPFDPLRPDEMLHWVDRREALRSAAEALDRARRAERRFRDEEAEHVRLLRNELTSLNPEAVDVGGGLLELIENARKFHQSHQLERDRAKDLVSRIREARSDLNDARARLAGARDAQARWRDDFSVAVGDLGLDISSSPDVIEIQLGHLDDMRSVADRVEDLRANRVDKIHRDIEDFHKAAQEMVAKVAPDLGPRDPFDAVVELGTRIDRDERARRDAEAIAKRISELADQIGEQERSATDAGDIVRNLQTRAGVQSPDDLRGEIEKAEQLRQCKLDLDRTIRTLEEQGDGHPVEVLEQECASTDPDESKSREQSIHEDIERLRRQHEDVRDRLRIAKGEFDAVGGGRAAADAAVDRQAAVAEIQEVAERYVRARTSAELLRWAIDRHRTEKQAPMLRRASRLFATLTLGSFSQLELDYEDDAPKLVGCHTSGGRVQVQGMSDGTVDQLYLALRVAALEDYLDRARPLPFIADDLFINFDDERSAAGIRVLDELAGRCQVIFLTHHEHLVDIACQTLGRDLPVVRLSG